MLLKLTYIQSKSLAQVRSTIAEIQNFFYGGFSLAHPVDRFRPNSKFIVRTHTHIHTTDCSTCDYLHVCYLNVAVILHHSTTRSLATVTYSTLDGTKVNL